MDSRPLVFGRRQILQSTLGLPFIAAACRSGGSRIQSMQELQERIQARLLELADSPEQESLLRSIFVELEGASAQLVTSHVELIEEFDRLMRDRSATSETIAALVEANVQDRARLTERLMSLQGQLKSSLTQEQWNSIVHDLNDAERMERILGRKS